MTALVTSLLDMMEQKSRGNEAIAFAFGFVAGCVVTASVVSWVLS